MRSIRYKFLIALVGLGVVIYLVAPPDGRAPTPDPLVIGPLKPTQGLLSTRWIEVSGGDIRRVASFGEARYRPTSSDEPLGAGLFATPGLMDAHVHLPSTLLPGQLDFLLLMLLQHGVTTVRELGSPYLDVSNLQSSISAGRRPGPRIFSCGAPLTGDRVRLPFLESIGNEEDLERAIEQRRREGLQCIKIYRGFPASLLARAAEVADRFGLTVVGHLPRDSPWDSTDLADIQHVCDPRCASLRPSEIELLIDGATTGGVRHTPTLVTLDNPLKRLIHEARPSPDRRVPKIWIDLFWDPDTLAEIGIPGFLDLRSLQMESASTRRAVQGLIHAGATLQVGTDTPFPFVIPGASVHEEMRLLEELGYSLEQVWAAATSTPGALLSGGMLGRLVPGAPADILLFREDPTHDLRALATLEYVIAGGRVYDVDVLRARVTKQLKYLDGPVYQYGIDPAVRLALHRLAADPMPSGRTVP